MRLEVPGADRAPLTNLLFAGDSNPDDEGQHTIALPPFGYRWYRLGPLLEVARRESR